jgi:hypothetical protein
MVIIGLDGQPIVLHHGSTEKADMVRRQMKFWGVRGARVRKMRNGCLRLVIANASDRCAARDALAVCGACTTSGVPFYDPASRTAWNGPTEVSVWFMAP